MAFDNQSLSKSQYEEIMIEIVKHHRFGGLSNSDNRPCRHIKYIRPNWDMRDGRCFTITFDRKVFDFRDNDTPMFERIMNWLNGGDFDGKEIE